MYDGRGKSLICGRYWIAWSPTSERFSVRRGSDIASGSACRARLPIVCGLLAIVLITVSSAEEPAREPRKPGAIQSSPGPLDQLPFPAPPDEALAKGYATLLTDVRKLDWKSQSSSISRALSNVWESNQWNEPADRFAFDLARDVSEIPPWEFVKRFELATQRLTDRYGLSSEQSQRLKSTILRESTMYFLRNGPVVLAQSQELVRSRLNGEPFTAEQVAKWTKDGGPLIDEVRDMVNRIAKDVRESMPADRRAFLDADLASFEKRRSKIGELAAKWEAGKWSPQDWGLQDDPIHQRAAAAGGRMPPIAPPSSAPPIAAPPPPPLPTRWVDHDPTTWIAYVLDVKRRFDLDAGQTGTAESIHAELVARAQDYLGSHREAAAAVPLAERGTSAVYDPVRSWFRELQARLEVIPTTSQRGASKP